MIGLVSISFRGNSVDEIVKACKENGLTCIEWGSDVHAPCNDAEKLNYVKKVCDDNGIKCCSYGTYFRIDETPNEEIYSYIKSAKILGTDVLRVWCGKKGSAEYTEEERQELFITCREIAKIAEKENVKICMECHINTFTDDLDCALLLMREVNSPNFKMYWQPNQFKTEEQNIKYAKEISSYVEVIHAFNWEKNDKFPLREGVEIWKKYMSNFKEDVPVLLEFMPDGRIESLKEESNALKLIVE